MSTYSTHDFLSKLISSNNGSDTWKIIENHFCDLGFDVVNLGVIKKKDNSLRGMFTNMNESWMEEYVTEGYAEHDPITSYAVLKSDDFLYSAQTKNLLLNDENHKNHKAQRVLQGAAEFGARTSVISPFHHIHEKYNVGFNLGTSLETNDFLLFIERNKENILLGTALAQSFTSKLIAERCDMESWVPFNDHVYKLTFRELETLNWLANGLRVDRIAEKMNISNDTVNFHIKSIKQKLNAKTREHAVAIAFIENLIH